MALMQLPPPWCLWRASLRQFTLARTLTGGRGTPPPLGTFPKCLRSLSLGDSSEQRCPPLLATEVLRPRQLIAYPTRERELLFSRSDPVLNSLSIAAWVCARLFPSLLCGHGADNVHLSPRISLRQQHGTSSPSEAGPACLPFHCWL